MLLAQRVHNSSHGLQPVESGERKISPKRGGTIVPSLAGLVFVCDRIPRAEARGWNCGLASRVRLRNCCAAPQPPILGHIAPHKLETTGGCGRHSAKRAEPERDIDFVVRKDVHRHIERVCFGWRPAAARFRAARAKRRVESSTGSRH